MACLSAADVAEPVLSFTNMSPLRQVGFIPPEQPWFKTVLVPFWDRRIHQPFWDL